MMLLHKSCLLWKGRTELQLGEIDGLELFGGIAQAALKKREILYFHGIYKTCGAIL